MEGVKNSMTQMCRNINTSAVVRYIARDSNNVVIGKVTCSSQRDVQDRSHESITSIVCASMVEDNEWSVVPSWHYNTVI